MRIRWWHIGLLLSLIVALLSPLASSSPDGLERVAEDKGFVEKAIGSALNVIPDYTFPGIENEAISTIVAGLIGTIIMFALVYAIGRLVRARRPEPH
jgi:hypothetical protein